MMHRGAVATIVVVVACPMVALVGIAMAAGPAPAALAVSGSGCPQPSVFAAATGTITERQRTNAVTIVAVGVAIGVSVEGQIIALATTLVESDALNVASRAVPESIGFPNDGVRPGDHDSVGLFQQRAGWGTVAERMDPATSARLFYRALLAVPNWERLDPGTAAQRVQRSAFPMRYGERMAEARQLYASLGGSIPKVEPCIEPTSTSTSTSTAIDTNPNPGSGFLSRPMTGVQTSPFGWRSDPITGEAKLHRGQDWAAPCGTPVYAAAAGTVESVYFQASYGNRVMIDHGIQRGVTLVTTYNHLARFAVAAGQTVARGQVIGYEGTTGRSTGCHLHFETIADGQWVNPTSWL